MYLCSKYYAQLNNKQNMSFGKVETLVSMHNLYNVIEQNIETEVMFPDQSIKCTSTTDLGSLHT